MKLSKHELDVLLYYLDEVQNDIGDAYIPSPDVERIYTELQSVTDNYYAQLEGEN